MKMTSVAAMVFFSQKYHSKSTWSQLRYVQSFLSTITRTLTTAFERHFTTEDFMDIGVKPTPINLTYHSMLLLFLSNKASF